MNMLLFVVMFVNFCTAIYSFARQSLITRMISEICKILGIRQDR